MIRTIEELLAGLVAKHIPILDAEVVKHPGTVGAMYEGLTEALLKRAIPFEGVDVATGFAEDADGVRSPQLDCMIVVGEGRQIPFTTARVFPIEDVIAVVEVKKTLYADDVADGYSKCRALAQLRPTRSEVPMRVLRGMFQSITQRLLSDDPDAMGQPWTMLYHVLHIEMVMPARVVLGYHGYKKLTDYKSAVAEDLEKRVGEPGNGPLSLPTLIMNDRHAIAKNDGLPYAMPMSTDGAWPLLIASAAPPLRVLLEIIWTRLCIRFGEPDGLFGDDPRELIHRFMDFTLSADGRGWRIADYRDYEPTSVAVEKPFEAIELTRDEAAVAIWLCDNDELDLDAPPLAAVIDVTTAIDGLLSKALVGPDPARPRVFGLLTKQLAVVTAGPRHFAGENISGHMTRWVKQNAEMLRPTTSRPAK